MDLTTEQVKNVPNKTGVGGFKDHPENRNNGGRYPRSGSFTYWFNYFKGLTVKEFDEWEVSNPESNRTVVSDLAYMRMKRAKGDLREFQEVANRSEGTPIKLKESDIKEPEKLEVIFRDYMSHEDKDVDLSSHYITDKVTR